MAMIELEDGVVRIDATMVGDRFGAYPSLVQEQRGKGNIRSRYEPGIDGDSGRHRWSLFCNDRCLSLIVDDEGTVVQRSVLDLGGR